MSRVDFIPFLFVFYSSNECQYAKQDVLKSGGNLPSFGNRCGYALNYTEICYQYRHVLTIDILTKGMY